MAKKDKKPQWFMRRIKRMLKMGLSRKEAEEAIEGYGKHANQRKHPFDYWVRKRKLERERYELRRAAQKRMKANAKRRRDRKRKKASAKRKKGQK